MNWIAITDENQLNDIIEASKVKPQVIYKHSTTCSISGMVKNRLDREDFEGKADVHYLDLLSYRPISAKIAEVFGVQHESPQVLVIKDGKSVYDADHTAITGFELEEAL